MGNTEDRKKGVKTLAGYLHQIYEYRHVNGVPRDGLGYTATISYLASKLLNLINVLFQFSIMYKLVGQGNLGWGFRMVTNAFKGIHFDETGYFPRVTFCEFRRDVLANSQMKEAQCALPVNILNEKLYLVLYFWFLILSLVTLIDLLWSLAVYLCTFLRHHQGIDYLKLLENVSPHKYATEELKREFVQDTLGRDGLLLLSFIDSHAGCMVASEVACELFNMYPMPVHQINISDKSGVTRGPQIPVEVHQLSNIGGSEGNRVGPATVETADVGLHELERELD